MKLFALFLLANYFIAIKKNEGDILATLDTYTPFLPPKERFYADPFVFTYKGIHYLFFEDYDYKKGKISYVTISPDIQFSEPKTALELPVHISFPSLFQEGEEIYMIPETHKLRSVNLFKALDFPDRWEKKRMLVEGEKFVDPILFKHEGYFWLFTAIDYDRLAIFYAKDLDSPFLPHPINRRYSKGRNAGQLFRIGERLIRPTMDCRISYGRSMILKEILLLTPTQFIEQEMATIEPTWAPGLDGTHTYSQNEDFVVYDGSLQSGFP